MNDIAVITYSRDEQRIQKLKDAHIAPNAVYHVMPAFEVWHKARGLSLIGVVIDIRKWDDLPEDAQKTLIKALAACVAARGLQSFKDLLTFVK